MSIAAEIIAQKWGGGGDRLTHVEGPIHHPTTGWVRPLEPSPFGE